MTKKTYAPSKRLVTPVGTAKFPKLNEPDYKFKKEGELGTKLLLNPEDAAALIAEIEELYEMNLNYQAEENNKPVKRLKEGPRPYKDEEDYETGEPTGMVEFTAKLKHRVTSNRTGITTEKRPLLVDKAGQKYVQEIGGGSLIALSVEAYGWYLPSLGAGVSLKLLAVQVHEAKVWGAKAPETAEDAGFTVIEAEAAADADDFAEAEAGDATKF